FGLAQFTDRTRLTKSGASLGTPAYMSPEQVKGESSDRRTDIWSLAAVLYEMLAGSTPFRGENEQAMAFGVVQSPHDPVTAMRAGLPLELDRILSKALAKDASSRYQNIADLSVDLRLVPGQPGGPLPPSQWRFRAAAPGFVCGIIVASVTYLAWQ